MKLIYHPAVLLHETGDHPESALRIKSLGEVPTLDFEPSEDIFEGVHSVDYVDKVKRYCKTGGQLGIETPLSEKTYEAAIYSANLAIKAAEVQGFAVCRPPGHHAFRAKGAGFCIFNNIAIAAAHLLKKDKKVLLIDFDGHHGDGTQSIFYESDQVLTCSIHQFPAFPETGGISEIGLNKGRGYNINIALPPGSGDDIFMDALKAVQPIFDKFKPDVVGIAAGFDGHFVDPLLNLRYSLDLFYHIGKYLSTKYTNLFATLEGGYELEILNKGLKNFIAGINKEEIIYPGHHTDTEPMIWTEYEFRIDKLLTTLKPIWEI